MNADATEPSTSRLANSLSMQVCAEEVSGEWPLVLSRYAYRSQILSSAEKVEGFGVGATVEDARCRAIMEGAERFSQFCSVPSHVRVATGASLSILAISPKLLGTYADTQYAMPGFPFAPYLEDADLEWIAAEELLTRNCNYIPIEFVYPRIPLQRKRLVAESSSGTAAHTSPVSARLAAICELIERDSILMFWHRRVPTATLLVNADLSPDATDDLNTMRSMGFVVVVCSLEYDLGIPCVLSLALKGNRVAYGAGCDLSLRVALEHSVRELGALLRWQARSQGSRTGMTLKRVVSPADHHALYDGGPFHSVLRDTLDDTIRAERSAQSPHAPPTSEAGALEELSERLRARGLRIYICDLTPPSIEACGVSVVRAFVPGLIPMYFGYDRIRLGCRRLWSRDAPGRLCNLLPHFMT